jgi:cob(I)alamin adenosyltransferase
VKRKLKIYTKGGDKGETSLLGGTRVPKSHERVEAYGTLDELNSFLGLIRDQDIGEHYREIVIRVQQVIFTAESWIAADPQAEHKQLPVFGDEESLLLEAEIDEMNRTLPELTHFILPGGHPLVSYCHVARTVCRRAERAVIRLSVKNPMDPIIIQYLNRLSDYLFVLARKMGYDHGATEIQWTTNP